VDIDSCRKQEKAKENKNKSTKRRHTGEESANAEENEETDAKRHRETSPIKSFEKTLRMQGG
jgi:hypothetical protein